MLPEHNPALVGQATDKGPTRPFNEDALIIPDARADTSLGAIYVVADGVGGQKAGDVAANLATRAVHDAFYQARQAGRNVADALKQAVQQANQLVYQESQARGVRMGCTLVAAVLHQGRLYLTHLGDARAYLLRGKKITRLTTDHTWVQEQVAAGNISRENAARHEFRNVVTRVLGNEPQVQIDLASPRSLQAGDRLLLCSDGLYDVLEEREIARLLFGAPAQTAAEKLVRAAYEAQAGDNVTALIIHYQPAPASPPVAGPARRRRWLLFLPIGLVGLALLLVFMAQGGERPTAENDNAASGTVVGGEDQAAAPDINTPMPTPQPTSTRNPTPTPTPTPTPQTKCIRPSRPVNVWLWLGDERPADLCGPTDYTLQGGSLVYQWGEPVTLYGQALETPCQDQSFYLVEMIDDPSMRGWVLASNVVDCEDAVPGNR